MENQIYRGIFCPLLSLTYLDFLLLTEPFDASLPFSSCSRLRTKTKPVNYCCAVCIFLNSDIMNIHFPDVFYYLSGMATIMLFLSVYIAYRHRDRKAINSQNINVTVTDVVFFLSANLLMSDSVTKMSHEQKKDQLSATIEVTIKF